MAAEPTKVETQVAGEAPAVAATEPTTQPAETNAADADPPVVESAATPVPAPAPAADAAAPADTTPTPTTETAAPVASAEDAGAKEESKDKEPEEEPVKETPLTKLASRLPAIKEKSGHDEMWGITLTDIDHAPTAIVLQKYLRANDSDVALAEKQLTSALEWRKKTNPTALLDEKVFDKAKFGDLGFVTTHEGSDDKEAIVTWNIYGSVKDNKATFGDIKEFLDWRVALMEFGTRKLKINEATAPIPDGADDPYRMLQVHDYLGVAFFRMDPLVKAASKETIQKLSMAYPELLSHKFFVNVPTIMGWVFSAMKLFLSPATLRKFHPLSSGASLVNEIPHLASSLPKEYGGSGPSVKEGLTVKLADAPVPAAVEPAAEPAAAVAQDSSARADDAPQEAEASKEEAKEAPVAEAKPEETAAAEAAPAVPATEEAKDAAPVVSATEEAKDAAPVVSATEEVKDAAPAVTATEEVKDVPATEAKDGAEVKA